MEELIKSWTQPACGHIPEAQGDGPAPVHPDEPHAGNPEEDFPIDIPPIADISFSVVFDPQDGQGTWVFRSPVTNSSNLLPQSEQRYSNIGIKNSFYFSFF
jgi:hypothetical protein